MIFSFSRIIIILFAVLTFCHCSASSVTYSYGKPYLLKNQSLLVGEIEASGSIGSLQSYDILYEKLNSKFDKVQYIRSIEYELKSAGFTKIQIDSIGLSVEISKQVVDILGSIYYLKVDVLNTFRGDIYTSAAHNYVGLPNSNVKYLFKIYDLTDLTIRSGFEVSTGIITIPEKDGGQWDLGSVSGLSYKCLKKGAKVIRKQVKLDNPIKE